MKRILVLLTLLSSASAILAGLEAVDFSACLAREDAVPLLKAFVWPEEPMELSNCVAQVRAPYRVTVGPLTNGVMRNSGDIRFFAGSDFRLCVTGHRHTVFVIASNVLYIADFCPISSGCDVSAFDLENSRLLWRTRLHGISFIMHSIYRNRVQISATPTLVIVTGREGGGDYVECLDRTNGNTVGHRIFRHWRPESLMQLEDGPASKRVLP